ncbi:MAG: hypothetical protein ACHQIO_20350 [Nevskiales bacterium]
MTEHADNAERELGRLDGRVFAIETRVDRLESNTVAELAAIRAELRVIGNTLAAARGGGSVLHWLITAIVSLAAWFHGHIFSSH